MLPRRSVVHAVAGPLSSAVWLQERRGFNQGEFFVSSSLRALVQPWIEPSPVAWSLKTSDIPTVLSATKDRAIPGTTHVMILGCSRDYRAENWSAVALLQHHIGQLSDDAKVRMREMHAFVLIWGNRGIPPGERQIGVVFASRPLLHVRQTAVGHVYEVQPQSREPLRTPAADVVVHGGGQKPIFM